MIDASRPPVQNDPGNEYIVATEAGILHEMRKKVNGKNLIPAPINEDNTCACSECAFMKMNTLEKLKKQPIFQESLSEIFYNWDTNDERYHEPKWKHIERTRLEELVGYSLKMDGYKSLKKLQLQSPYEHKQEEFAKLK